MCMLVFCQCGAVHVLRSHGVVFGTPEPMHLGCGLRWLAYGGEKQMCWWTGSRMQGSHTGLRMHTGLGPINANQSSKKAQTNG